MAAATALTIASVATTALSTGASFFQAHKQKKQMQKAQKEAKKAMLAAKKKLDVNFYEGLSIDMTPYEREREALLSQGTQVLQAAKEGEERGAGVTASKIMAGQLQAQGSVSDRQTKQLESLAKLTAEEESRLRDEKVTIDLAEAEGAQQAAADASAARSASIQQGFQGLTSMAQTGLEALPLFGGFDKMSASEQAAWYRSQGLNVPVSLGGTEVTPS